MKQRFGLIDILILDKTWIVLDVCAQLSNQKITSNYY